MIISRDKIFKNEENRQLAEIQERDKRFGVHPIVIWKLDQRGLNHLEIISLTQLVGKKISEMSQADGEFLDTLEETYGIEFNTEYKEKARTGKIKPITYFNKRLDHYCFGGKKDGCWLGVSSLILEKT